MPHYFSALTPSAGNMPSRLFGVDSRIPSLQSDAPRPRSKPSPKPSPRSSTTELRRSSIPGMDHIKRPTLASLVKHGSDKKQKDRSLSKDKFGSQPASPTLLPKPVKLSMYMESPPILFIGTPQQSTGALVSGRLQVTPNCQEATLETITMYLECTTTYRKPVSDRCRECQSQVTDLYEWNFLTIPKLFNAVDGMQELPFSHLVPGHLPATTHGHNGTIDYSLHVKATARSGEKIEFRRDLDIRRALFPGNDKTSIRIFPPTDLNLHVTLPSVIHPIGEFPVACRMTGITQKKGDTQTRWRLRKLTWRIQEIETVISPACAKHAHKVGGDGKGIEHGNQHEIGMEELKEGWKTDMDEGVVEGEFKAAINAKDKPNCGMEAQNGNMKISHVLVLELVIAEEWATNKKPNQATPTGAARVLRTQYNLSITSRAGMGLSWEDEMPPMYEDVPISPPRYQNEHTTIEDYEGDDLHEDVEHLNLNA